MVHRDVKAANLLLTAKGTVKLADFGVSVQLQSTLSQRGTAIGTPLWMAPEVIQEGSYSSRADVWSLGICGIEMAQMRPPHWELQPALRALFRIPTAPPPTLEALEAMDVRALVALLRERRVGTAGCLEKADLVQRAAEALHAS